MDGVLREWEGWVAHISEVTMERLMEGKGSETGAYYFAGKWQEANPTAGRRQERSDREVINAATLKKGEG